jgi:hypothetical protein
MAYSTWPATLPLRPLYGSWSEKAARNVVEFGTEVGPSLFRRRSTVKHDTVTFSMAVDKTQKVALDTFYATTTACGALKFNWEDPTTSPLVTAVWRFTEAPQYAWNISNKKFTVQISLRREAF